MKHAVVIVLVLFLAGCGTARTVVIVPPPNASRFASVEVAEQRSTVQVPPRVTDNLRSVIERKLVEQAFVVRGSDLRILYAIVSYEPGSRFTRWFWGGLGNAGEGTLAVMVRYIDSHDTELAKIQVEGRIGIGILGGSFSEAVTKAAEKIVEFTVANFCKARPVAAPAAGELP